jgi:hypothetical protein
MFCVSIKFYGIGTEAGTMMKYMEGKRIWKVWEIIYSFLHVGGGTSPPICPE